MLLALIALFCVCFFGSVKFAMNGDFGLAGIFFLTALVTIWVTRNYVRQNSLTIGGEKSPPFPYPNRV